MSRFRVLIAAVAAVALAAGLAVAVDIVPLGSKVRVSEIGPDGDPSFGGFFGAPVGLVAVAHNTQRDEYLVVWTADDAQDDVEVWGRRLDAAGTPVGNEFQISDTGVAGATTFGALALDRPAVAYNPLANDYLVAWTADDDTGGQLDGEFEIFIQKIDALGAEIGGDTRISDIGGIGANAALDAQNPTISYNSVENEFLVAFSGDDVTDGATEIFVQTVSAGGTETGVNDRRITTMGALDTDAATARTPAAAYDPQTNGYLVAWEGSDNTAPLVLGEDEIFGQRLTATGVETGTDDFRISQMGPDGNTAFDAGTPAVAFNPSRSEYLVVWTADDNTAPLVEGEEEIFGQLLSATGAATGSDDFRISDMGPDGNTAFDAIIPAVAFNAAAAEYAVLWQGDDDTAPLVDNEFEVFLQRLAGDASAIGADVRVSQMGPDGNAAFDGGTPAIAAASTRTEFLTAWFGDDVNGLLGDDEFEVYARRLGVVPPPPPPPAPPPPAPPAAPVVPVATLTKATTTSSYKGKTLTGTLKVSGSMSAAGTVSVTLTQKGKTKVLLRSSKTLAAGAYTISLKLPKTLLPGSYTAKVTPSGGTAASRTATIAAPKLGIVGSAAASAIRGGAAATTLNRLRTVHFRFKFLSLPAKGVSIAVRTYKDGKPLSGKATGKRRATPVDAFISSSALLPSGRYRSVLLVGGKEVAAAQVRLR